jgi:hypothetical protein
MVFGGIVIVDGIWGVIEWNKLKIDLNEETRRERH